MAGYLMEMFGVSLALTIIIELPVAFLFGMCSKEDVLLALLVNVLTNPPAVLTCWLLGMAFPALPKIGMQVPVEIVVVAVEAFVYCRFAKEAQWEIGHPIILSAVANTCSWLLGIVFSLLLS